MARDSTAQRISIDGVTHAIAETRYERAETWITQCDSDWGTYAELLGHPDVDGPAVNCLACLGYVDQRFTAIEAHEAVVRISKTVMP